MTTDLPRLNVQNREENLKQLMEQRSNEIYQEIKAQQRKSLEAAERESMVQEELWMEQGATSRRPFVSDCKTRLVVVR